jgi:hypothetical protein
MRHTDPGFSLFLAIFAPMLQAHNDLQARWWDLEARLVERFGKKPDMEAILFLIGVQEFGELRKRFSKEQKQDLMHIAVCSLFRQSGYYELEKVDEDGWPHFRQLRALPEMNMTDQESFLKDHILLYFESDGKGWERNEPDWDLRTKEEEGGREEHDDPDDGEHDPDDAEHDPDGTLNG